MIADLAPVTGADLAAALCSSESHKRMAEALALAENTQRRAGYLALRDITSPANAVLYSDVCKETANASGGGRNFFFSDAIVPGADENWYSDECCIPLFDVTIDPTFKKEIGIGTLLSADAMARHRMGSNPVSFFAGRESRDLLCMVAYQRRHAYHSFLAFDAERLLLSRFPKPLLPIEIADALNSTHCYTAEVIRAAFGQTSISLSSQARAALAFFAYQPVLPE